MPFELYLERQWQKASVLTGPEDFVPEGAFRVLENVRLDRLQGVPTSRPGMLLRSATQIVAWTEVRYLGFLDRAAGRAHYAQLGTTLYRVDTSWASPTPLSTAASAIVMDANHIDGFTVPWKFFVAAGVLGKDNGTTFQAVGLVAPVSPPIAPTLQARGFVQIHAMDAITGWTGFNVTGPVVVDTAILQEGTGSLSFVLAANTLGGITLVSSQVTGTHTGGNVSASLVDAVPDFLVGQVRRGSLVNNATAAFSARVTRIAQHELWFDGADLGANRFDTGDVYAIPWNLDTFGIGLVSGTDDGVAANRTTTVIDSGVDFRAAGVRAGMWVWNLVTGARGEITSIGTTVTTNDTLTCSGGFASGATAFFNATNTYRVIMDLVRDDDWLQFYIRFDDAAQVEYVQLDVDLDGSNYANNFYTVRLNTDRVAPASGVWSRVRVRKSEFLRIGNSTADWSTVLGVRISVQTGPVAGVTVWVDELSLLGGYDLEGELEYTVVYANETTGALSPPPKDQDDVVYHTTAVLSERHPVSLNLTPFSTPPVGSHATHLWIYRRGGTLAAFTKIASVPIGTTTFTDTISELQMDLSLLLEVDNDPPPPGVVALFGPGALQRLFLIHDRNKVRFSKHWEYHYFRSESFPIHFEFEIGDGSEVALAGLVVDQVIFVWTDAATWAVQGQGPDAFVPLPVPSSRGLAGAHALTFGDNRIFFLATDGLVEQDGVTQMLVTEDIRPFFQGETVHGVLPINRNTLHVCRLEWHAHPTDPMLVLLYPDAAAVLPNKRLILKKNRQTGHYTECYFDASTDFQVRAAREHRATARLFYGTQSGHVYEAELDSETADGGAAIVGRVRTGARDQGSPRVVKTYGDVVLQADTGGAAVGVRAEFDRSTSYDGLGNVTTTAADGLAALVLEPTQPPSVLRRHMLALECTWSSTTRVTFYQLGWHADAEAEDLTFYDTGTLTLPFVHALKWLDFDVEAPSGLTVQVWLESVARWTQFVPAIPRRRRWFLPVPAGLKGKRVRITCHSPAWFLLWGLQPMMKPWGQGVGYGPVAAR